MAAALACIIPSDASEIPDMAMAPSATFAIETRLVSPSASKFVLSRVPPRVYADRPLEHELAALGLGVGASEAPRGTLFHDYTVDRNGLLKKVNLIVATGQNNLAMNQTVAQIARHYVRGNNIPEPMLNRIEHGIRCYDPCLSCSTHAVGQMPLHIQLIAPDGQVLDEKMRG